MAIALGLVIGLLAGVCGGVFGIGGGIIIVPACVFFLGMEQKQAQGTALVSLLLPVGFLAFWNYWKSGALDTRMLWIGVAIAFGIFCGGFFGSKLALSMNEVVLRRSFATLMAVVAAFLFFKR